MPIQRYIYYTTDIDFIFLLFIVFICKVHQSIIVNFIIICHNRTKYLITISASYCCSIIFIKRKSFEIKHSRIVCLKLSAFNLHGTIQLFTQFVETPCETMAVISSDVTSVEVYIDNVLINNGDF